MDIKKIGILTSGGDAPGMNAAIRAAVKAANYYGIEAVGVIDGYIGLIKENFKVLTRTDVSGLNSKGGTILGTVRFPEFKEESVRKQAVEIFCGLLFMPTFLLVELLANMKVVKWFSFCLNKIQDIILVPCQCNEVKRSNSILQMRRLRP